MYDVLVYVFENCQQTEVAHDSDRVAKKLSAAGFEDADISEALHWLAGVLRAPPPTRAVKFSPYRGRSIRRCRRDATRSSNRGRSSSNRPTTCLPS